MKAAESFLKYLRAAEQAFCFAAFAVMATALISDVLARELRGTGLFGASQVGVFGMVVVAFFGVGLASADGAHLRPRFADGLIPKAWERQVNRLADVITGVFYFFVAWVASQVTLESFELADVSSTLRWPIWPFQAVLVVAFLIGGIRHSLYIIFPDLRPLESSQEEVEVEVGKAEPKKAEDRS